MDTYWNSIAQLPEGDTVDFAHLNQQDVEVFSRGYPFPKREMDELEWVEFASLVTGIQQSHIAILFVDDNVELFNFSQKQPRQHELARNSVVNVWCPTVNLIINIGATRQLVLYKTLFPKTTDELKTMLLSNQKIVNSFEHDIADITLLFSLLSNYKVMVSGLEFDNPKIQSDFDLNKVVLSLFAQKNTTLIPEITITFDPLEVRDILMVSPVVPEYIGRSIRTKPLEITFSIPRNAEYVLTILEGEPCPVTEQDFLELLSREHPLITSKTRT